MNGPGLGPELDADLTRATQAHGPYVFSVHDGQRMGFTFSVRGVRVRLRIDAGTWPWQPPQVDVVQRAVIHPLVGVGGQITALSCLRGWNRTMGLCTVLAELDRAFIEEPPLIEPQPASLLRRLLGGLWGDGRG